jgi:delta(3,5)-delta(2,4)-dienoyl-CoA isomerase
MIASCDIRYCTKNARFSVKEVDIGLCPDIGTLPRLQYITNNESLSRELVMTGRSFDG